MEQYRETEQNYKYDAFISYRHRSPDKPIAEQLQKLLEAYVPPKSLRKEGERKKLHLFRDETELPTSSDLGGDIKRALEQSRFLVVICTPEYEKSKWCMEELRYFKELHGGSNRNILTMLAGDPDQPPLFPDLLRFETASVTEKDGNVIEVRQEIEPLASNVSAKTQAKMLQRLRTEFLRVAAPLFDCGFDDLYNRELRRRTRRKLTFAFSAVAVLAVTAILSTAALLTIRSQKEQIEANALELSAQKDRIEADAVELRAQKDRIEADALELRKNNSALLVKESQMLEKEGDPYGALEAAYEALPDEDEQIDALPGALAQTAALTGAYMPDIFAPVRKLPLTDRLTGLCLLQGGTRLAAVTTAGLSFWNTETGECVKTLPGFTDNKTLFYTDPRTDNVSVYYREKGSFSAKDMNGVPVYTMYRKNLKEETQAVENAVYVCDSANTAVMRLSPEDGSVIWKTEALYPSFPSRELISSEGIPVSCEDGLLVLDPETGRVFASIDKDAYMGLTETTIFHAYYAQDHLMLYYTVSSVPTLSVFRREGDSFAYLYTSSFSNLDSLSSVTMLVRDGSLYLSALSFDDLISGSAVFLCQDLESGELKWSFSETTILSGTRAIGYIEPDDGAHNPFGVIFAAVADRLFVVRDDTGELITVQKLPSAVQHITCSNNGFVFLICQDGEEIFSALRYFSGEDDSVFLYSNNTFPSSLSNVSYCNNVYAVPGPSDSSVYIWRFTENKAKEVVFRQTENSEDPISRAVVSPDLSLGAVQLRDPQKLVILDLETKQELCSVALDGSAISDIRFLGNDHIAVIGYSSVFIYDTGSGENILTLTRDDYYVSEIQFAPNGDIVVPDKNESLIRIRPGGAPQELLKLSDLSDNGYSFSPLRFSPDGSRLLLQLITYETNAAGALERRSSLLVYAMESGTFTSLSLPEELLSVRTVSGCAWTEDAETLYLLCDDLVYGFSAKNGDCICHASGGSAVDLLMVENDLCLLSADGNLIQVEVSEDELKAVRSLSLNLSPSSGRLSYTPCKNGRGVIRYQTTGWLIDVSSFQTVALFSGFCGIDNARGSVYSQFYDYFYAYPLLSDEDLRALAAACLGLS